MFSLTFGKEIEHMSNNLNLIDTNKTVENYTNLSKNITGRNSLLNDSDILDKINQTLRNLYIDIVNSNNETENDLNNTTNNSSDSTLPVKEEIMKPQIEVVGDEFILNFSFREILLFSAVIAATDTVAALTFVKEENEPKLFAILFGEGVINDAVCIVLYGIIKDFSSSNQEFTSKTPFKMFGSFMTMFFFSFLIGAKVGILSSLFLKKLKFIHLNRVQECSIIVFFAFISYTLTEELGLSPIIALLFTGIFMSHYTFYNLSFQAREESSVVSRIMSNVAEAFVFTYLGLTVIYNTQMAFSLSFFFWELIFVVSGRFAAIYGISYFMSLFKIRSFNIKSSQKGIMSCAGSIRGAIAFGLAISIDTKNRINK
jgi:sodium/hydrogen exchanger-like protein 6/7